MHYMIITSLHVFIPWEYFNVRFLYPPLSLYPNLPLFLSLLRCLPPSSTRSGAPMFTNMWGGKACSKHPFSSGLLYLHYTRTEAAFPPWWSIAALPPQMGVCNFGGGVGLRSLRPCSQTSSFAGQLGPFSPIFSFSWLSNQCLDAHKDAGAPYQPATCERSRIKGLSPSLNIQTLLGRERARDADRSAERNSLHIWRSWGPIIPICSSDVS